MIADYKIEKLRSLLIDAKVIAHSLAFTVEETLAINRLAKRIRDTIEEKFEAELDFIEQKSQAIRREIEREVREKYQNADKANAEFIRRISTSEELNTLVDKENEINETKIQFGIDKPIKLTLQKEAEVKLEKAVHDVKYRCMEQSYKPIKSLLHLVDEGFVIVKQAKQTDDEKDDY